jgi:ATP-dependent helicase/DNAse subunit B
MAKTLMIAPTARKAADQLKRVVGGAGCVMGHLILTFPQLVAALAGESDDTREPIDHIGERIALRRALEQARLPSLPESPGPGLIESLLGAIRSLKTAALTPADLRQAAHGLALATAIPLDDLAKAAEAYDALLAQAGLRDHYDREALVLAMLHRCEDEGRRPRLLKDVGRIVIAEIYDLSLLQFMIAASLIRIVGAAEVTIQAQPNQVTNATRFAELTWNRFVGEESIADQTLPEFVNRAGRIGRLSFLLRNIFASEAPEPPPIDDTVQIVKAPSPMREAEEVARAVRELLEKSGGEPIALGRIAIVARDLGPYADYLETAFRRYRIPLRLGRERPLIAAPAARAILDLLRVPAENFGREALGRVLGSALFRSPATGYFPMLAEAGYIDRTTAPLLERLAGRRDFFRAAANHAQDQKTNRRAAAAADRFERARGAFARLLDFLEPLDETVSVADHVKRLRHALAELHFDPAANPLDPDAAGNAAAAGPIDAALDTLAGANARLASDRRLNAKEFAAEVAAVFAETTFDIPGDDSAPGVLALPVMEARGLDFDFVFVMGLNDGVFPAYRGEDPLIPDAARVALNPRLADALRRRYAARAAAAPGPILRTRRHRNAEDPFLFFLALSMPSERVTLTFAAADDSGRPLARSPFIDEVVRLLGGGSIREVKPENFIPPPSECRADDEIINCAAELSMFDGACPAEIAAPERAASISRRIQIERARRDYLAMPTREELKSLDSSPEKAGRAGPYDGRIGLDPRLREILLGASGKQPRRWTAGRLDAAAACGFRYFAAEILRLEDAEEIDVEQSGMERGSLAHDVLRELIEQHVDFSRLAAARKRARELLEKLRAAHEVEARDPAFFAIAWENVERIVDDFVRYENRRLADGAEQPSESHAERSFTLKIEDRRPLPPDQRIEVVLSGRIDRLDLYRNRDRLIERLRVIDYKTSRSLRGYKSELAPEHFGLTSFQIPLYLMAARNDFAGEIAPKAKFEGGYLALAARDHEKEAATEFEGARFAIEPEERKQFAERAEPASDASAIVRIPVADRIVDVVSAMAAGRFDVDPLDCDEWCPYRSVCRYRKGEN